MSEWTMRTKESLTLEKWREVSLWRDRCSRDIGWADIAAAVGGVVVVDDGGDVVVIVMIRWWCING